jgi:hypothetical protein
VEIIRNGLAQERNPVASNRTDSGQLGNHAKYVTVPWASCQFFHRRFAEDDSGIGMNERIGMNLNKGAGQSYEVEN